MSITPDTHTILLLGMKHSGKSTLGKRLASRLGVEFNDLDELIEELYDPSGGTSCREIFKSRGVEFFSELEARAARQLAELARTRPTVAALGGGTIENPEAMNVLKEAGIRVYLKDSFDRVYERVMRNGLPAFLSGENPRGDFLRLFEKRTALYEAQADLIVDVTGMGVDEAFRLLLDCLSV